MPSGPDASDTKLYSAGKLTSETALHTNGSKDVYTYGILNKSYVAEHDTYNSAGTLTDVLRTHTDGSLDYTFHLAADGTKATDQYDAAGLLKSHSVVRANGASSTQTYAGNQLLTDVTKYATGSSDLSDSKTFTNGTLTRETIVHANGSKEVFDFNVTNKAYNADHYTYNSNGAISVLDLTMNDTTHTVTAYSGGAPFISNEAAQDKITGWWEGKNTFVFEGNFGKDTISGFRVGNGALHDVIWLDTETAIDFTHLKMQQIGHDTVISVSALDTITLTNTSASGLSSANFAFGHHDLLV